MASPISARTAFIAFSLVVHGVFAVGLEEIDVKKAHAATSIQIAEAKKKPAKTPEPAKVDPPPRKPEPPAREKRAAAPKPAEAPEPEAPPPSAAAPLADMPDFGVSLTGDGSGTGLALPAGASTKREPRALAPTKSAPKRLTAAAAGPAAVDPCEEPPAKPRARSMPQPAYTDAARAASIEGKVRVQLTIDETGRVVSVKLLQGLGYGLDEAALAAARQAEFEPAVRCGKPSVAPFTVSMRFSLQ